MSGLFAKTTLSIVFMFVSVLSVTGQSIDNDRKTFNASSGGSLPALESSAESTGAKAKLILAHGNGRYSGDRAAPSYSRAISSGTGQLSVDWVTPKSIRLSEATDFVLVVRNRGPVAVEHVRIVPHLPTQSELIGAQPTPIEVESLPNWNINRLEPQEEFRIRMSLRFHAKGPATPDARITYSTTASTTVSIVEPKLQIWAEAPDTGLVGNQVFFNVTVTNPGTGPTENTILQVSFPNGIDRVAESNQYDIGVLNPGESRSIRVAGYLNQLGQHLCGFVARTDFGLHDETSAMVTGMGADLDIRIDGPSLRYVNRPAEYTLKIANTGTAPARELLIRCGIPQPFAFMQAENHGSFDAVTKNINWAIDQLQPGEETEVRFRLQAATPGSVSIEAEATGQRGLHEIVTHLTEVKGIPAILLEVVDVDDPVEVGAETFYEIIVTNQGTTFANNVVIVGEVPEEMEIVSSQGPSEGEIDGQKIRFELERIAPRADAIYRLHVRGLSGGDVRMRVEVDAESLDSPVLELESTKVYQD